MKIIKNTAEKCWKIPVLCQSHIPHNVDGTKLHGGVTDKANNQTRKTNNTIIKLQRDTSRCINIIQKKRNDSSCTFRCILNIRTRGTKNSRWIFYPRNKIQHTYTNTAFPKWTSACRMQYNKTFHGISHGIIIAKIIYKLLENNIHESSPIRNGPSTTTNTSGNGQYSFKQHCQCNGQKKRSRAIDMIFYGNRYIIRQNRFNILLEEGKKTLVGYVTKHHPIWHYIKTQNTSKLGPEEVVLELPIPGESGI